MTQVVLSFPSSWMESQSEGQLQRKKKEKKKGMLKIFDQDDDEGP